MSHESFKNRFLIAMPTLNDPYFHQTVTLLFEHNAKGAMGLIINKPLDISIGEILQHLSVPATESDLDQDKVMMGGPAAGEQGFIIHTHPELCQDDVLNEEHKITVSASKEVLEELILKKPNDILVCLGYSVWKAGQLEQEIADNAWILSPVDPDILFTIPFDNRWRAAGMLIGVDFDRLSSETGHG